MQQKKDNINLNVVLIVGAAVGAYYFVLKPILEATGLKSTAEEEETKKKAAILVNNGIWEPVTSLLKKYPPANYIVQLMTVKESEYIAKEIWSSWSWIDDDEERVYAAFKKIRYQSQISSIVDAYNRLYQKDFYEDVKNRLSSSEFAVITNIISDKPSGITKR